MAISAQSVVDAIKNYRQKQYTLEDKIEQKLNDPTFYMNEAVRYLQGYALNIAGNVKSYLEIEELKKKYTEAGWGFYVEHRGLIDDYMCITVRLKFPDEFTSYLDECKAMAKQIRPNKI